MRELKNPKEFGQAVLRDFIRVIDELYPEGSNPGVLEREAAEHESFAQNHAQAYLSRESYFKRLDEHVLSGDQPLVILGESGSGKSALLANWALRFREEHPNEFVLMHFIGATSGLKNIDRTGQFCHYKKYSNRTAAEVFPQ